MERIYNIYKLKGGTSSMQQAYQEHLQKARNISSEEAKKKEKEFNIERNYLKFILAKVFIVYIILNDFYNNKTTTIIIITI